MEAGSLFGRALQAALAASGKSQAALAAHLEMTPGNISRHWIGTPDHEPKISLVLAAEEFIGCSPGTITRYLGVIPASGYEPCKIDDALMAALVNEEIDQLQYNALMAVYISGRR